MIIKDAILAGADEIDRGKNWPFDRNKYMNASEADRCIRQQWYEKNGTEGEEQDWGFARRGSHAESYIVKAIEAAGVTMEYAGRDQVSWQDEKRRISATPDGLIRATPSWIVPEFKTIDPRTNKSRLPRQAHVTQLKIAVAMVDQKLDRPDGVGIAGKLIYMDASNFNDLLEFDVAFDAGILDAYAKRARRLFRATSADPLDREGKRQKDGCKYCPFRAPCGVALADAPSRGRGNRGTSLDAAAVQYMDLKDQEDAISASKKLLAETIKTELLSRKRSKLVVNGIDIAVAVTKGRASLDKKAAAAAGIDLRPFEKVGNPIERLTVKRVS